MITRIKIGGGEDGIAQWDGGPANHGWEMKFNVDQLGNVSGGNKNDSEETGGGKKIYSGTFLNNVMNVHATFIDTGQVNEYSGRVTGNHFHGRMTVVQCGSTSAVVGQGGNISGTVQYE